MTREAMKQALEWLDRNSWPDFDKWAQEGKEVRNALRQALEQQPAGEPVAWEGGEGWESLAWELCADECGEEACTELVWEGGPIPEPWGDRWMKYEDEAKRLIALVQKHTSPQPAADRATELLKRCENEMRYAGWDKFEADNTARNGVYEQVKQYLEKNT